MAIQLKRTCAGSYAALFNGHTVHIWQITEHGFSHAPYLRNTKAITWKVRVDGKLIADGLNSKKQAVSIAEKFVKQEITE